MIKTTGDFIAVGEMTGQPIEPRTVCAPTVYEKFPDWFQTVMNSGISPGSLTAIVQNLLFNHLPGSASSVESATEPEAASADA
jgi:xanthine/uracil permease